MKSPSTAAAILLAAITTSSCGSNGSTPTDVAPPAAVGPLPDGVVARVGPSVLHSESIGRIAALQRVDVRAARDLAVRDALFARGAEARGLDVEAEVRGVLARRLLRSIRAAVAKIQNGILEPLNAGERATFMQLLDKLVRAKNGRTRVPLRPMKKRDADES